jgi:hypothetical protein
MATVKKMKKAQDGIMSTKLKDVPGKVKNAMGRAADRVKNSTVGDAVDVMAPGVRKAVSAGSKAYKSFKDQVGSMNKGLPKKKMGGPVKKAANGKSFPDLNKDGKITKADILKGRGVIAKSGTKMKSGGTVSMELGSYGRQLGKNYTGKATKAVGLTKANYGASMMKMGGKTKKK